MNYNIQEIAKKRTNQPIIAWSQAGSHLYNLATPESDDDIFILTEGRRRGKQYIEGDLDLRITSFDNFMNQLWATAISETDFLFSGEMKFMENTPYQAMLEDFRTNPYQYFSNSEALALKFLPKITENIKESRREYKSLKASLRAITLAWRMLYQRDDFNPRFSKNQRDTYWEHMEEYTERFSEGEDWMSILEDMHFKMRILNE